MRLEWTAVALFLLNVVLVALRGRTSARPPEPDAPVGPVVQAMAEDVDRGENA